MYLGTLLALCYSRRFLAILKTAMLYCHVLPVKLAVLLQSAVLAFLALEAVFSHAPAFAYFLDPSINVVTPYEIVGGG